MLRSRLRIRHSKPDTITLSKIPTHRWSTTTTTTPANTVRPKRRRKAKSLALLSFPVTTKDRVRWLRDRNEVLRDNYYNLKHLRRRMEDLGNTAEERLTWVREKIFGFWRGENIQGDVVADPQHVRPRRKGLKMDAKWWFWNLAFAVAPAVLLSLYCEFIGKPQMFEMNRRMHVDKMIQQYGDSYREEDDEELQQLMQDSDAFSSRVYNAVAELYTYVWNQQIPTMDTHKTPISVSEDDNNNNNDSPTQPTLSNQTTPPPAKESEEAKRIAELKEQLQALEEQLKGKAATTREKQTLKPTPSPIEQRVIQAQAKQAHQRKKEAEEKTETKGNIAWEHLSETVQHYYNVWTGNNPLDGQRQPQKEKISSGTESKHNELPTKVPEKTTINTTNSTNESESDSNKNDPTSAPRGSDETTNGDTQKDTRKWWSRLWPKSE